MKPPADVLKPFNPYWHCEQVWCPPITRNNAVAKSNAWLSPPGNLAGQAWNYQLQMIDKTLIRGAGWRRCCRWYAGWWKQQQLQRKLIHKKPKYFWPQPSESVLLDCLLQTAFCGYSSTREFLDIPQPRRTFSNGWTEGELLPPQPPPLLKWQKLIMAPPRNFYSKYSHANPGSGLMDDRDI